MAQLTIYVETTIVSYLTARPSRDLIIVGRQASTREWWERARIDHHLVISAEVLKEASRGDPLAAQARMAVLADLPILDLSPEVETLAAVYREALGLPDRAAPDATHLAAASIHRVDAIVSWNCSHIASIQVQRIISGINQRLGLPVPFLATPEMLLGEEASDVP